MKSLRTPDERFENLPGFSFPPHYHVGDTGLRMHYLDEGSREGGCKHYACTASPHGLTSIVK